MIDLNLLRSAMSPLATGAWLTIQLTAWVIVLGSALALPIALCKNSTVAGVRAAANGYVMFFRGTPALLQIFLLYYGAGQFDALRHSPLWPVLRDPFWCVVIALALNSASYTGKTLASALAAVPRGLREAAFVLGISRFHAFWSIQFPLALRTALPAFGNELILTCKATSLGSTVTLLELTGTARLLASETYAPYEAFLGAGLVYLALNYALMAGMRSLEAGLDSSLPLKRKAI